MSYIYIYIRLYPKMLIISLTISNNDITLSPTKALPVPVLSRSEFVGGCWSLGGHPVLWAAARCLCLYLKS